jgi:2-polyprenyl-3-methyl-5-hydroxy-6-metoxy-1,4-benzoquinol methylase
MPENYDTPYANHLMEIKIKAMYPYINNKSVLNIGCGNPDILYSFIRKQVSYYHGTDIVFKDDDNIHSNSSTIRFKDKEFDVVVAMLLLEEIANPQELLKEMKHIAKERVIVVVPNANSLNRVVGSCNGMLNETTDLGIFDIKEGHKRMYNLDTLQTEILTSGLFIKDILRFGLKPVHMGLMESLKTYWNQYDNVVNHPLLRNVCAEFMVICNVEDTTHPTTE